MTTTYEGFRNGRLYGTIWTNDDDTIKIERRKGNKLVVVLQDGTEKVGFRSFREAVREACILSGE